MVKNTVNLQKYGTWRLQTSTTISFTSQFLKFLSRVAEEMPSERRKAAPLRQMMLHWLVSSPAQQACLGVAGSSKRPSKQKFSSPLKIPPQ